MLLWSRRRAFRFAPRAAAAALVAILGAASCSGASGSTTPEGTISQFSRALRERRYEDAYEMMSRGYRRRVPLEEFKRHLEDNPGEAREAAAALARVDGEAEQVAVVQYAEGEEVELVYDDGSWRIASNVVDFYDQSTPRAALRTFVRAMERKRYDVIMRLVPNADREGMSPSRMRQAWEGEAREEIERLVANLRASIDNPIEEVGDRATMPYGERFTVQFVREDGAWKVEDPD